MAAVDGPNVKRPAVNTPAFDTRPRGKGRAAMATSDSVRPNEPANAQEPCDLECGDRFFRGASVCRHGRNVPQSAASLDQLAATPPRLAHSSGPWTFERISESDRKNAELDDDAGFWIAGGPLDEVLATVHAPCHGQREEANASLIAASPDLLASLREFVAIYDGVRDVCGPVVREKLARADAAIAKAEGR